MSDNSNNVHFSGVRFIGSPYLAIKSALASLGPIMARCGPQMNLTSWCTFQILGGCQGRRTRVGVTTVSNSLILGGWVTKVSKNGDKK